MQEESKVDSPPERNPFGIASLPPNKERTLHIRNMKFSRLTFLVELNQFFPGAFGFSAWPPVRSFLIDPTGSRNAPKSSPKHIPPEFKPPGFVTRILILKERGFGYNRVVDKELALFDFPGFRISYVDCLFPFWHLPFPLCFRSGLSNLRIVQIIENRLKRPLCNYQLDAGWSKIIHHWQRTKPTLSHGFNQQ